MKTRRYNTGETVGKGHYWNFVTGDHVHITKGGVLPTGHKGHYYRLPAWLVIVTGPVVGLAFAIFLPLIGMVMTVAWAIKKLGHATESNLKKTMLFQWEPQASYFDGKGIKKEKGVDKQNTK